MRPYYVTGPFFKATELSRTLVSLRNKAGLTPIMLAKATNIPTSSLNELESGRRKPTLLMLNRLTAALHCEDLAVRFPPVVAFLPGELSRPGAVHLRLQHLIEVVAEGNQRRFALGAGLPEGSMSTLVNNKLPLTPARQQQLLTALPTLSPDWLMRGEGEAFAPHPTPTFAVLPPRPKPAAPTPTGYFSVRYKDILVMPSLEPWDPSLPAKGAGPSKSQLLGSLMQRVQLLAERECGMGPAQVVSVLRILEYVL